MTPIVRARGLGKTFLNGTAAYRRSVFRAFAEIAAGRDGRRETWALKGVDLELSPGGSVAVIGPNGAGKSTLLLLLAGILEKTEGELRVTARANLFFPFGATLQPRLTVRRNFDLAAALLGLSRARYARAFDEIVSFSGLESRLEDRLGELSTGLSARVAFSVAVHAEQELVLADEMLAVGDMSFQARCRDAFDRLRRAGASLVVVTHDMSAAKAMCREALYLRDGRPAGFGLVNEVVQRFERDSSGAEAG